MKVSVVISAFNEEAKIESCLKSVSKISEEIIFIDNTSTDRTKEIAKKYTSKIYVRENNPMLNVNKNFGFSKATGRWILCLDADEHVTEELADEILEINEANDISAYFIPRKNIIFGKWIRHTGWYPDPQLRLFKKGSGKFEEKQVHEAIKITGTVATLKSPMVHYNYENISQFLNKMIKTYTVSEAEHLLIGGYKYNHLDIVKMPVSEFVKRYFAESGYKDGMHGLVLSVLQGFYHLVVFLRLWEANNYPSEQDTKQLIFESKKIISHEFGYWIDKTAIDDEKNSIKKKYLQVKRKLLK